MHKYCRLLISACMVAATASNTAFAHGEHAPMDAGMRIENPIEAVATDFGRMGSTRDVSRTVEIVIDDNGKLSPASLAVRQGETVRLSLRNTSKEKHAFMLGTATAVREHAAAFAASSPMSWDGMSSRQLAAGQAGELLWQFTMAGTFAFACLVPGHADAGMRGTIEVSAQP